MVELELSMMLHHQQVKEVMKPLLDEFERQTRVRVHLQTYDWSVGRSELNRVALYHHGPDVSEIGSTWAGDLIAMNALRPFSAADIARIGKPEDFLPTSWETCHILGDPTTWCIPLLGDCYFIYYRKDILAKAGIDETTAFSTHAAMEQTAAQLEQAGVEIPVLPIFSYDRHGSLHTLASWVWSAGGDFYTADGKRVLFDASPNIEAIQAFFRFHAHLSTASAKRIYASANGGLYENGEAAITLGTLTYQQGSSSRIAPIVKENWGVAGLPGTHFVGGTNLIVWKHTRYEEAALDLVQYLTDPAVSVQFASSFSKIPPRHMLLSRASLLPGTEWAIMADSLRSGRTYHPIPLLGLIEDRLSTALLMAGRKLYENPKGNNLNQLLRETLTPIAHKLNLTLER